MPRVSRRSAPPRAATKPRETGTRSARNSTSTHDVQHDHDHDIDGVDADVSEVDKAPVTATYRRTRTQSRCVAERENEYPQDSAVMTAACDKKRSQSHSLPERSTKRQKRSDCDNSVDGEEYAGFTPGPAHDSGYISEPSNVSTVSANSLVSPGVEALEIGNDGYVDPMCQELAKDDPVYSRNPYAVWNCCQGPSRDKVSQMASELFPSVGWGNPEQTMRCISEKELKYNNSRSASMMDRHEELEPYMRAILLDWMVEVCEAHQLNRETYHLAVDYLDRYLSKATNVRKNQLQLTGATTLFIAAKLEEVMPPRAKDFAYVTDGACTPEEILMHEMTIMQTLQFRLYPVTANMWLEFFLAIATRRSGRVIKECPLIPNILPSEYVELCRLLEFSMMDLRCHKFPYRYLAAATIFLIKSPEMALRVSGLPLEELQPCIDYMTPFFELLAAGEPVQVRYVENYPRKTAFLLQNKNTTYSMIEQVWKDIALKEERNYGYKSDKRGSATSTGNGAGTSTSTASGSRGTRS